MSAGPARALLFFGAASASVFAAVGLILADNLPNVLDPGIHPLEPVLRSGALFVPQSEVHVVRPHDGTLLGRVPDDIIPDLLRVDERCDVYVAEESGHVAAYSAAPRLTLVSAV